MRTDRVRAQFAPERPSHSFSFDHRRRAEMSRSSLAINSFLRSNRLCRVPSGVRYLATPASKTEFSQTLENGPSLDDFVSGGASDRIVLGNSKAYA